MKENTRHAPLPERLTGLLIGMTAFLLPLKFGTLAVLPEAASYYPEELFAYLIISWPAHSFGILSGVLLLLSLAVFHPLPRTGTPAGKTILLWGVGLPLAALPGFLAAETSDYAVGEFSHVAGFAAYVWSAGAMLQRRPEWRNALLYAFATGALCTGISGLHQYFFGFREMRAFLAEQLAAGQEISPVLQAKIADTRVYATFVSCNALAGFLLLLLPVAIWAAARWAERFEPVRVSRILFPVIAGGILAAVLLMTKGRGAFLAAILTLGAAALTLPMRRLWRGMLIAAAVLVIAGGALYIHHRGRGFGSMEERVDYLRTSFRMVLEHPLTGHGWGGFFYRHMQLKSSDTDESAHDPHNLIASFATQAGIPAGLLAAAAFLYPLWLLGKRVRRLRREPGRSRDWFPEMAFWGEIAFLLHALMDVDLAIPANMAAAGMVVVAALTEPVPAPASSREKRSRLLLSLPALAVGCAAIWGNFGILRAELALDKLHQLTRPAGTQDRIASSAQVMDAYRTARQIRPNSPFPPEAAGTYFLMLRDYPTARELFLEALRHAPSRPALHQRLFETERQSGNRDQAQYHLRRMLELFPSNPKYQAIYRENAAP